MLVKILIMVLSYHIVTGEALNYRVSNFTRVFIWNFFVLNMCQLKEAFEGQANSKVDQNFQWTIVRHWQVREDVIWAEAQFLNQRFFPFSLSVDRKLHLTI